MGRKEAMSFKICFAFFCMKRKKKWKKCLLHSITSFTEKAECGLVTLEARKNLRPFSKLNSIKICEIPTPAHFHGGSRLCVPFGKGEGVWAACVRESAVWNLTYHIWNRPIKILFFPKRQQFSFFSYTGKFCLAWRLFHPSSVINPSRFSLPRPRLIRPKGEGRREGEACEKKTTQRRELKGGGGGEEKGRPRCENRRRRIERWEEEVKHDTFYAPPRKSGKVTKSLCCIFCLFPFCEKRSISYHRSW